jgi:hypothetical protein
MIRTILFSTSILFLLTACGGSDNGSGGNEPAAAQVFDCLAGAVDCPELVIDGDAPDQLPGGGLSEFHGFADPTIRKDPDSDRIWMAYSWPNVHVVGLLQLHVPGVDTHLAYSDDGGVTWQFHSTLWPSEPALDLSGSLEAGYIDHEVPNLLARNTASGTIWYGVRLNYFVSNTGGYQTRKGSSFRLAIMQADSPPELAGADAAVLGSAITHPNWGVDIYLASLHPDVYPCDLWNEPALYWHEDELYLVVHCLGYDDATLLPTVAENDLVVFATTAQGHVTSWVWRYVGKLAGHEEALELGGVGLTQVDIVRDWNGQWLAVVTPEDWSDTENDFIHYGCRVVEIENMTSPCFSRDGYGNLKVRAVITASDQDRIGPAACSYHPDSATGVIIGRRYKSPGFMSIFLHTTGIHP